MASADKAQQEALRLVIEQQKEFYVAGEATDTCGVEEQIQGNGAKVLLLDWELPVRSRLAVNGENPTTELAVRDLIAILRLQAKGLRIIVLTLKPKFESEAYAIGADCVLSKTDPPEKLVAALIKEIGYTPDSETEKFGEPIF